MMMVNGFFCVVLLFYVTCTQGFKCYNDDCLAGYQYCVKERQRCFHCKDRPGGCRQETTLPDCRAYCTEQNMSATIQGLETRVENLTDQLNTSKREIQELKNFITTMTDREVDTNASIADLKTSQQNPAKENRACSDGIADLKNTSLALGVSFGVVVSLIALVITIFILRDRWCKKNLRHKEESNLRGSEGKGLLGDNTTNRTELGIAKADRSPNPDFNITIHCGEKVTAPDKGTPSKPSEKRHSKDSAMSSTVSETSQDERRVGDTSMRQTYPVCEESYGCGHSRHHGDPKCNCVKGVNSSDSDSDKAAFVCSHASNNRCLTDLKT